MRGVASPAPLLPFFLRRSEYVGHREAVVALDPDSLQHGRDDIAVRHHHLIQAADTDHTGIFALGVDYSAVANDIVDDDQRTCARHLQTPVEVNGITGLVRIDED